MERSTAGRSSRLYVRSQCPGHRTLQAGGLSPLQTALRYLPYADHGGRCGENDFDNHSFFAHYHCRNLLLDVNKYRRDIDQQQERLRTSDESIAQTGYEGYVAHEFVPKNGMDSLRHAYELCNI